VISFYDARYDARVGARFLRRLPRFLRRPLTLAEARETYTIRSFEKLTAAGMTFVDADVIRVLEEVLPTRFGGGPTDYQFVEGDEAGQPRIRLLGSPDVGPLDSDLVVDTFLTAISRGSRAEGIMGLVWRDAKLVSVERRTPFSTASGKILHLHTRRTPSQRVA
jgi:hypothetical protein